jgi:hypothetical protein
MQASTTTAAVPQGGLQDACMKQDDCHPLDVLYDISIFRVIVRALLLPVLRLPWQYEVAAAVLVPARHSVESIAIDR